MSNVSPQLLKDIRPAIEAALAVIAKDFGLQSLKCGSATYNPTAGNFIMKLEGVGEGGIDKDAARYESSRQFGLGKLPPLGTVFQSAKRDYKIVGINTIGTKVIVEKGGKKYLFPTDTVIALCAVQNLK